MGKLSTPKPPQAFDATSAIKQASDANQAAAQTTAQINRPDQQTPFGNLTWQQGGAGFRQDEFDAAMKAWQDAGGNGVAPIRENFGFDPNAWTSKIELDPTVQALLEKELGVSSGMFDLLGTAMDRISGNLGTTATTNRTPLAALEAQARGNYNDFSGQVSDSARVAASLREGLPGAVQGIDQGGSLNFDNAPAMPTADAATRQRVEDALYSRMTSRLDPQFTQAQAALESRLANQGITQGSEAYQTEMDNFGRTRNDAYLSAINDAIVGGGEEMQRLFGMGLAARQQGVNEASTIRDFDLREDIAKAQAAIAAAANADASARAWQGMADSQQGMMEDAALKRIGAVTNEDQRAFLNALQQQGVDVSTVLGIRGAAGTTPMPQFQTGNVAAVEADPVMQALLAQYQGQLNGYNAQMGSRNSLLGGLANLGGSAMMAYALSDRRAKERISLLGRMANGLGIYSFHYKPEFQHWGRGEQIGVMADEVERVKPEAVIEVDGMKLVNYGLL